MIWVGGRIVPDDALAVSVLDRTFEHGLGLFETLRTWGGRAPLLDRHLARLGRSAEALGLPLDPDALPDQSAIDDLRRTNGAEGDVLLRITLSGGLTATGGATLWMRSSPLPPPTRPGGAWVSLGAWEVLPSDPMARHKPLNYWSRRIAFESARAGGFDEALNADPGGLCWEGSRTNLFVVARGTLMTPCLEGPIVPGVMRGLVLEHARSLGLEAREPAGLPWVELRGADELFLTNSVRGLIPVARGEGRPPGGEAGSWAWPAPGPWTERLRDSIADWLQLGGGIP